MAIDRSGRRIYVPDPAITSVSAEELPRALYEELHRIAYVLRVVQLGRLEPIYEAPNKPRDGDIVLALSPLNLGSGDGVYARYGGVWNFLG